VKPAQINGLSGFFDSSRSSLRPATGLITSGTAEVTTIVLPGFECAPAGPLPVGKARPDTAVSARGRRGVLQESDFELLGVV
jgi:hypothetical protein